jgi:hypothetical protein
MNGDIKVPTKIIETMKKALILAHEYREQKRKIKQTTFDK